MASRKRTWTDYPGVYFVEVPRKPSGTEKVYYIVYRRDGRQIEEKAGYQYRDDMTPAKAARMRGERLEGRAPSNEERREAKRAEANRPTIARLWEAYDEARGDRACAKGDAYRFKNHIAPYVGEKTPSELCTLDLDRMRLRLLKSLAPQSVKHVLAQLKRIVRHAVKAHLIPPPVHLHFEMPTVDAQKTEMLTPEQMKRVLDALANEADITAAAGVRLALATGMRHAAICSLRWDDLDFDRGFITLRGETAKNSRTQRIPMSPPARAILSNIPKADPVYVFPGKTPGTHRTTFRRVAERVKREAGLPDDFRYMHGLRHAYASALASSGKVDLYTLQKLLTHESPAMTQRYAHLADEAMQRAATVMGEVWMEAEQEKND